MGSCVSFSRSPPAASTAAGESARRQRAVATAKVVNLDGSMAQFAGPVTAREALLELAPGEGGDRRSGSSPPRFLCSSDELGFDAPARALAADEALRPGQLYFALPAPMLRRPLSGNDMAALAVRAATALAVEAGLAAGGLSPQRQTKQGGAPAGKGRRRRLSTARVAPLLVASSKDDGRSDDGSWNSDTRGGFATRNKTGHDGDRTVGKASAGRGAAHRSGGASRRRPGVQQRLSAIAEDEE
ncbi:hypothetical protein GQ55_2G304700 [Panicum hallii var. hallii]|uniref:DUF4228 domain-containing protein n=1 Tax=Panicum hallii var. hallii TaxID=1504633 RepID=A0A2T7EU12_9POAL|nr:hypothetical protein GQ55_2G304700 [Panicum hallii var. hallii]